MAFISRPAAAGSQLDIATCQAGARLLQAVFDRTADLAESREVSEAVRRIARLVPQATLVDTIEAHVRLVVMAASFGGLRSRGQSAFQRGGRDGWVNWAAEAAFSYALVSCSVGIRATEA